MRRWGVFWGVVLIAVGAVLLAESLGLLPVPAGELIGPLIIVLLGVWLISGAYRGRSGGATTATAEPVAIPLGDARSARVVLRHGAGRLEVASGAAPGMLVDGTAFGGMEHRETRSAEGIVAELEPAHEWPRWTGWPEGGLSWRLRLAEGIPLALQLHVGASENHVDLAMLTVPEFDLETGASSSTVRLPVAGATRARIRCGAAAVRLEVPLNVAARIRVNGALNSVTVDPRFPVVAGGWESPEYASANDRVDIDVEMGAGELRIV